MSPPALLPQNQEEIDAWCQNEGCALPVYLFANKCDLLTEVHQSFLAGARMERACREAVRIPFRVEFSIVSILRCQSDGVFSQGAAGRRGGTGTRVLWTGPRRHLLCSGFFSCVFLCVLLCLKVQAVTVTTSFIIIFTPVASVGDLFDRLKITAGISVDSASEKNSEGAASDTLQYQVRNAAVSKASRRIIFTHRVAGVLTFCGNASLVSMVCSKSGGRPYLN